MGTLAKTYENYAHTWWTPLDWKEWVDATLGSKVFDPCPEFYYPGVSVCGLRMPWESPFYCNHPGAKGSTRAWWRKFSNEIKCGGQGIWCAFSVEQLRHMDPSPFEMNGWLIMPKRRVGFIWGGPDTAKRKHGEVGKSPGNWTVFWSSVRPAEPPEECVIVRTWAPSA